MDSKPQKSDSPSRLRSLLIMGAFALAYFSFGKLSLYLAIPPGYASPIFPSAGIALAGALLYGAPAVLGTGVGSFLIMLVTPPESHAGYFELKHLTLSLGVSLAIAFEAVLATFLIRRFVKHPLLLASLADILWFLFLGGPLAVFVGTALSVGCLYAFKIISADAIAFTFWNWWVGDIIGVFIATPIALTLLAKPRTLWKNRITSVGLPLLLIIILYVVVFIQAGSWEKRSNQLSLERIGSGIVGQMTKSFQGYVNSLYALESVMSVEGNEEQAVFESVGKRWLDLYPGIYDLSWNPKVTRAERVRFENKVRKMGFAEYEIGEFSSDGRFIRAPDHEEYFPARFIMPYRQQDNVMGFNQQSSPERWATMVRSRDSDRPAAVGPIRLVQKVSFRTALLLYAAVYRGRHNDLSSRRKNLKGFVKAVFSFEDVIQASLGDFTRGLFRILIWDDIPSRGKIISPFNADLADYVVIPTYTSSIELADRQFQVQVIPTEGYLKRQRGPGPWIMLASGLIMSGLLAAFLLTITGHAFKIEEQLVEKNTLSERLERNASELRRSNAELEQFAYVASHDLKEPLRTVSSYLRLIEKRLDGSLDADTREFMAFAIDGAKRMSAMIADLLEYAKIGKSSRREEPTDINDVLAATVQNLRTAIEESHAEVKVSPLPSFRMDYTEGVLLFQNLIDNALKYRAAERPAKIEVTSRSENGMWLFSIKDNGVGIAKDYLSNIFLMFKRAHSKTEYPGTGIGLAICKKIVERHGGRIWAESVEGQGSAFCFLIPQT